MTTGNISARVRYKGRRRTRTRKPKPTKREKYHRILVHFMRYKDGVVYPFGHEFMQSELAAIILKALKKDKKERGGHPQLRVLNR